MACCKSSEKIHEKTKQVTTSRENAVVNTTMTFSSTKRKHRKGQSLSKKNYSSGKVESRGSDVLGWWDGEGLKDRKRDRKSSGGAHTYKWYEHPHDLPKK